MNLYLLCKTFEICVKCGRKSLRSKIFCSECLYQKSNICGRCGHRPVAVGKTQCSYCLLVASLRSRIYNVLKTQGIIKTARTEQLLGCSVEFFRQYISGLFQPGMTLENHGKWHIDHIRPCASFDLTDLEQQKQCFNYTNLQPLWAAENISKGAKLL